MRVERGIDGRCTRGALAHDLLDELLARVDVVLEGLLHVLRDVVVLRAIAGDAQQLLDLDRELLCGAMALGRIALERAHHDRIERGRHVGVRLRGQGDRLLEHHVHGLDVVAATEQPLEREGLPHHAAEREDVAPAIARCAPQLLRRHVAELALDPGLRAGHGLDGLRDAEIDELHGAVVEDDDVAERDIVMHELDPLARHVAELVGGIEPLGGIGDQPPHRERIEPLTLAPGTQHGEQRFALEVLHRDEVLPIGFAEVVDVDDVGMLHERGDARLVQQHVDERLLGRELAMHQLDDDELLEARRSALEGQLNLRHPTLTDPGNQLVPAEPGLHRHRVSVAQEPPSTVAWH